VKDAKNITLKAIGKGWTVVISMDATIVQQDGIQTMLSRIVEDVISTWGLILQSSIHGHSNNLEKPGMTGYSEDTMKSSSTAKQT